MKEIFKKITKTFLSGTFYFVLGVIFFVAFVSVRAAWNSTVSSGQILTPALFNDVVARLVSVDSNLTSLNAGNINYQQRNCERITYSSSGNIFCPVGKYAAGVWDDGGGMPGMNGIVCCN